MTHKIAVTQADIDAADEWIECMPGNFPMQLLYESYARHRLLAGIEYEGDAVDAVQRLLERGKAYVDSDGYLRALPPAPEQIP